MKNIHVLPTEKPSRLYYNKNGRITFSLCKTEKENTPLKPCYNIYITSDEEIKEDYVIAYGFVIKVMMFEEETLYFVNGTKAKREECKKIILTTDQDLIKDGVQAIDDEFLEWFVKNQSCESVEVTYGVLKPFQSEDKGYLIHCPDNEVLEEPKQETLGQMPEKQEEFNNITNKAKGMENQESGLQEIKTELDNLNAKLFNLSNEFYTQTANLCGEFNRPINEKLHKEVGDFYMDIFKGQIGFQMSIIDEIVNTLNHLKSATNK